MRCPKCHYVSFDGQNRCRNCGYDLSLSQLTAADTLELPTNTESTATALADLSLKPDAPAATETPTPTLVDRYMPPQPVGSIGRAGVARAPARGGASGLPAASGAPSQVDADPLDLPLFGPTDAANSARSPESASAAGARRIGLPAAEPAAVASGLSETTSPGARRAALPGGSDPPAAPRSAAGAAEPDTAPMRVPGSSRQPVDDRPLVSGQAPPRAPLSVRRPTGEVPRARRVTPSMTPTRIEEPRLDLGGPEAAGEPDLDALDLTKPVQPRDVAASIVSARAAQSRTAATREAAERGQAAVAAVTDARAQADPASIAASTRTDTDTDEAIDETLAPIGTRIAAGAIDVAFMLAIDAVVLYFTLRITGLPYEAWRRLPLAPLLGFLAMLHGGYLAMFTAASGQTMGKMLTSIRVVSSQGGPVPFGSAVVRAVVWLLTIVPAGVGFIPAFLANDRRALHDRFADTKVVKSTD